MGPATMSTREIIVLGTSSQVPTRARSHNSMFLLWDELGILFDPGEGTQRQMIMAGLTASQITHVAITHFHGDHCLGLAGMIQRISLDRVPHTVEIIYPAGGQHFFERLRYASSYFDCAKLAPRPISGQAGEAIAIGKYGRFSLSARALEHGIECYGYRLQEDHGTKMLPDKLAAAGIKGPMVGELAKKGVLEVGGRTVRVEDVSLPRPGQSFALVMDTRPCAGAAELAKGTDLLVCEATYLETEAADAQAHFHMTAAGSARLARDAGARRLVLTHFSQRYTQLEPFVTEASAVHPDVHVVDDLSRVSVPKRAS
jgi:ribonuclease Z